MLSDKYLEMHDRDSRLIFEAYANMLNETTVDWSLQEPGTRFLRLGGTDKYEIIDQIADPSGGAPTQLKARLAGNPAAPPEAILFTDIEPDSYEAATTPEDTPAPDATPEGEAPAATGGGNAETSDSDIDPETGKPKVPAAWYNDPDQVRGLGNINPAGAANISRLIGKDETLGAKSQLFGALGKRVSGAAQHALAPEVDPTGASQFGTGGTVVPPGTKAATGHSQAARHQPKVGASRYS
jgi:hypothetical protein